MIVDVVGFFTAGSGANRPASAGTAATIDTLHVPGGVSAPKIVPTPIPRSLQRSVQPDLNGLLAIGTPGEKSTPARMPATAVTAFKVSEWSYLQTPPDPAVGRIYGFTAAFTVDGTCTGTVVARNLVLTAAPCVANTGYAFAPQQFGSSLPYGVW